MPTIYKHDKSFLLTKEWAEIRADAFVLAGYKCEICNRYLSYKYFQVHHLTYERYGGDEEPGDLMCLCRKCHQKIHGITTKKKKLKKKYTKKRKKSKKKQKRIFCPVCNVYLSPKQIDRHILKNHS